MKIEKVGSLGNNFAISGKIPKGLGAILTNLDYPDYPDEGIECTLPIIIGQRENQRAISLDIVISGELLKLQISEPVILNPSKNFELITNGYEAYYLFNNKFFTVTTNFLEETSLEEATLLVKKLAFSEDSRLKKLRQEVESMDRIINNQSYVRTAIPDDVKLLVYSRDEGRCVKCGSRENLHFDHIIPVSKGGGNSEANIQILCQYCNLKKSDKITF